MCRPHHHHHHHHHHHTSNIHLRSVWMHVCVCACAYVAILAHALAQNLSGEGRVNREGSLPPVPQRSGRPGPSEFRKLAFLQNRLELYNTIAQQMQAFVFTEQRLPTSYTTKNEAESIRTMGIHSLSKTRASRHSLPAPGRPHQDMRSATDLRMP